MNSATGIVLVFLLFTNIYSKTYITKIRASLHIQALIDRCHTGDTVALSAGEYRLTETIIVNKGILITGSVQGSTILMHGTMNIGRWVIKIDNPDSDLVRISKLYIKGNSPESTPGIKIIEAKGQFRIDNCMFNRCSRRAIEINGDSYGVIDHCTFIDNWYTAIVVYGTGNTSWNGLNIEKEHAVFVEDCEFEQKSIPDISMAHHIASNNGSYYVFRYNKVKDGHIASHAIDAHGFKFGGERGSRYYEIYNNSITADHRWAGINIRGGDGVIFNNEFSGEIISPIHLMHESKKGDGQCQYPCKDQIRDLYIWNNSINGNCVEIKNRHPLIIKENRDYFLHEKKGYRAFSYPHPLTIQKKNNL
jgi:hypothetical protein